ncbi:hypothetical protein [Cohnella terricola]|uniref:hypothetical protein n=1 Tax=Cohnella terricola TaxID=1289167 RepID=UPI0016469686|nr:hypothetical protein [Cohnella terricola]
MSADHNRENREPTIAPGVDTHNSLEQEATDEEKKTGDSTEVTHLYLDRTPDE